MPSSGASSHEGSSPVLLRFVPQRAPFSDCAVATLATLMGVDYEVSLSACVLAQPNVLAEGMTWQEIKKAAKLLGHPTQLLRKGRYSLEESTGILCCVPKDRKRAHHVVILWEGRVVEGNGELWGDVEDYLQHYAYRPGSLLVRANP